MTAPATGRRGRPRAFDPEAVLACAMDLFWRSGYGGTSIPDLSEATGLSTSSIYNAFGSKHDLYVIVFDRYLDLVDDVMLGPMLHGIAGVADVQAFLGRLESAARDTTGPRGCLATKAVAEFGPEDPDIDVRVQRYRTSLRAALAAALARAAEKDQVAAHDVAVLTDAVAAIVLAHNLLLSAGAKPDDATALLRTADDLIALSHPSPIRPA